jgi:nucleoside-diphosphate-sugar epimerase
MPTVAVFGAGGFVGAACVERLLARGHFEVRPFIHSSGGAWRLSPLGIALRSADLRDRAAVREALRGCTHVVNASRGEADVMLAGLDHLLEESLAAGIERFVHLSSVSAWGERTPGTLLREQDAPSALLTGYGRTKLDQDRRLEAACRKGLPCLALAPPYISGAYSPFLLSLLDALRAGTLALVEAGELPCSLVDVENLALAIERALLCEVADGSRVFVTDDDTRSWRDLVARLAPLAENPPAPPAISREEARTLTADPAPRASLAGTLRTLGSVVAGPNARALVAADPLLGPVYRRVIDSVPDAAKRRLRSLAGGGRQSPPAAPRPARHDLHLLGVQLRAVRHDCSAARTVLGYRPALGFDTSMDAFERWYRITHGFGTPSWAALRAL